MRRFQEEEVDVPELTKYPLHEVWKEYVNRSQFRGG